MIIVDSSEMRVQSRLPKIARLEKAVISDDLEAITGADIMVSPVSFPVSTEALIKRHLGRGAVLVQFKAGRDLVESIFHRDKVALARMQTSGAKWWQSCILATGIFLPNIKNGNVMVAHPILHNDGRITYRYEITNKKYTAFATAKRLFPLRGGYIQILPCEDEVQGWLLGLERDLIKLTRFPVRTIYPEVERFPPPDALPFQRIKEVKDARSVVAALDKIGIVRASNLYETIKEWNKKNRPLDAGFKEEDWVPTLQQMVLWATMWKPQDFYDLPKVPGWGPKTRRSVREQFGLFDGQEFNVMEVEIPQQGEEIGEQED